MKKYVLITMNIGGINGAEQYLYNKMRYLKDEGYQVFIFSGRPEEILINGFREYADLVNPALRFFPYSLNRREREKTLKWMESVIALTEQDTCTIESSNVTSALWSELLSARLHCRHLTILMQEKNKYSADMRRFLRFKYDRHELAGIMDHSVREMLADPNLPLRADARVSAFCSNVVQECVDDISRRFHADADATIGSIGRLEKEYVLPLVNKLAAYFENNKDKNYNLLLIGGCADVRQLNKIKATFASCQNVNLITTGNVYPIPYSLAQNVDVFISSTGAASATFYAQRPTIKIDHITAEPMAIMGYDIVMENNKFVPNPAALPMRPLDECIDLVLSRAVPLQFVEDYETSFAARVKKEFDRQLLFGQENPNLTHYDVLAVKYHDLKYCVCSVVSKLFGTRIAYIILEIIRKTVRG